MDGGMAKIPQTAMLLHMPFPLPGSPLLPCGHTNTQKECHLPEAAIGPKNQYSIDHFSCKGLELTYLFTAYFYFSIVPNPVEDSWGAETY